MRYFPVSIDTKNKRIAVLGGGKVAARKINTLINSELLFDVYSDNFAPSIYKISKLHTNRIVLIKKHIDKNFAIEKYDFCLLATDDKFLNKKLSIIAKTKGVPVLDTSDVENCDFLLNKVVLKNGLAIGVSTNGKSPTVAKLIGSEIENLLNKYDGEKIEKIFQIRQILKKQNSTEIKNIIGTLWESEIEDIDKYLKDLT